MNHFPGEQTDPRRRSLRRRVVATIGRLALGLLVLALLGIAVSGRAYSIPTNSMAPALQKGDRVLVERLEGQPPTRGELWVFRAPPTASATPVDFVKRVVGLPGETIEVKSGVLCIDDVPLEEPYLSKPFTYSSDERVILGPDEYWMLGDNRDGSHDSHIWGPVSEELLIGRVRSRLWPLPRMGKPE